MFANLIVGLGLGSSRDVGISDRWRREINPLRTWFSLFSLVFAPRGRNVAMMLRGVWHGLRGTTGPYQ